MIREETFKRQVNGQDIHLLTLCNAEGMRVQVMNYGAKMVSLYVPNRLGVAADVLLGFSTFEEWQTKEPYFNAVIGRCANRIKNGRFVLEGTEYQLAINNGTNHLHGGVIGYNERVWTVEKADEQQVCLSYLSPDGEEHYPGNLHVKVTYRLTADNALEITYEARTDKTTVVGFTQHAYFNLCGEGEGNVREHLLQVEADNYTPFDQTSCPTGEILPVEGTPMDFRQPTRIGDRIDDSFFAPGRGIDNNFVLRKQKPAGNLERAAILSADGRTMEVWTTLPGLQVYTGNWVEPNIGKSGRQYGVQHAVCLEAQNFPDAINHTQFPSPALRPGEVYRHQCVYKFV